MNDERYQARGAKRAAPDPARPGRFLLEVTWADALVSRYPWGYLRGICPCANCRGQVISRMEMKTSDLPDQPETRVAQLQHVGHYALGVIWEDAHQTILPWDYLRELDPDAIPLEQRLAFLRADKRLL